MQTGVKPLTDEHVEKPLADYTLGQNSWYYLEKMTRLCKEKGVELVLIKAPSLSPVWWDQWDAQVEEYAKKNDLTYINMLDYQEEIGIDWQTDTYDTGLHLNVYGAEKASSWFGNILRKELNVPDHREDDTVSQAWEEKVNTYNERKKVLEQQ